MPLPSPRATRVSALAVVASFAATGILLGPGCGGSGGDTTGAGGAPTSSSAGGSGDGGFGGTLFSTSSSTSANSTGTGTGGTGGAMPICDPNPTLGVAAWAVRYGDANAQNARGVAQDAQGNVLVTGAFTGTLSLGTHTLTSAGAGDTNAFVAKIAPDGQSVLWAHSFGDAANDQSGGAVAVDANGNVLVAGEFRSVISFVVPNPSYTSNPCCFADAFLVKLDKDGNHVWSKKLAETENSGIDGNQTPHGVAVDSAGNIAIVGEFQKQIDLGDGMPLGNAGSGFDAFVIVFDALGALKWKAKFGDAAADQQAYAVAFDKNGNIVVTGKAAGTVNFGMGDLTAPGTSSAFVVKMDSSGVPQWGKLFGQGESSGDGIAVDGNGNVFVTGEHTGAIDFGGGALPNAFGPNVFVAKLDGQGNHVWSKSFGDDKAQQAVSIGVDSAGRAVIAGRYAGKINFGGGALVSAGGVDAFAVKLDTVGCQVWAKSFGDLAFQEATGVFVDAAGNSVVTGTVSGSVDFGKGTLTGNIEDIFVAKFGP